MRTIFNEENLQCGYRFYFNHLMLACTTNIVKMCRKQCLFCLLFYASCFVLGSNHKMILKLLICFGGVFFSYLLNGIAIESITNTFGDKIFTFYLFMVFIPSLFNVVFAKLALVMKSYLIKEAKNTSVILSKESANSVPKKMYFLCAMFFVFSMLCSNASLAHINYPTQLVLKSSKPIPILFCACFLSNKRYPLQRFASTWIIVGGVISFMYEQYSLNSQVSVGTTPAQKFIGSSYVKGWGLVFASLGFDGMLAATQERMRQSHELDTHLLMYHVNAYSSVFLDLSSKDKI
ncbi:solute carrier family 35 member B1-like isoform X2 [Hydractinia symbiolongicarpus]|uniref:solute carrier family 35 member B1-like isoform X2 n=1 Tax=Hydractinia symbiolongicarpus TaxID=13093 RepID=UPI00254D4907|nr:solute carrier family 35 member B1-like isoform X2 [Hydractinia symbiolongicarpus]